MKPKYVIQQKKKKKKSTPIYAKQTHVIRNNTEIRKGEGLFGEIEN